MRRQSYEEADLESALMDAAFISELTEAFVQPAMGFERLATSLEIEQQDRNLLSFAVGHTRRLISEAQAIFNGKPAAKLGDES